MGFGDYRKVDPESLRELIKESGVSFKENARSYLFTCPRCSKYSKLAMLKQDGRFICWKCADTDGFRGRPEFALTELLNLSIQDIRRKIYGAQIEKEVVNYLDIALSHFYEPAELEEVEADQEVFTWPSSFYPLDHEFSARGLKYLESRGVSLELATRYGVRYCPPQRRIIFPIEVGNTLMGWQARAVFDTRYVDHNGQEREAPKILTTGKREANLMFQNRLMGSEHAILCEGPMDAIKADLCGGNVGAMGKVVSRQHLQIIRNAGIKRLYNALDPDASSEIMKICREMKDLELYRLEPARGFKDLGEMSPEAVLEQFRSARRISHNTLFIHLKPAFRTRPTV